MEKIKAIEHHIEDLLEHREVNRMDEYLQHGSTSTLEHSLGVAYSSFVLANKLKLKVDHRRLVRGAMLHDFYLYDWHEDDDSHRLHGFHHPKVALKNAKQNFEISHIEADIIESHMWPLTIRSIPKTKEAAIVCAVDKFCSVVETISAVTQALCRRITLY